MKIQYSTTIMSLLPSIRSVPKYPQIMLHLVFLALLCGSAFSDKSSALNQSSSSIASNSSVSKSDPPKSEVSHAVDSKSVNGSISADLSQTVAKSSSSNSSLDGSTQAEGMVHVDPEGDLSKKLNPEALMRGFYVFVGLSVIVMAYIAWKSFGKRPTQVHRYGVVANREDLEMAPLDSDDGDEDDTTHFDLSKHRLT